MVKSMTGFGRYRGSYDGLDILCEVKSVNSRYLDTNVKISRGFAALEEKIKQFAANKVSRGKLDIYVSIERIGGERGEIAVNEEFLKTYVTLLKDVKKRYGLGGKVSVDTVASRPEVFTTERRDEDMDKVWESLAAVLENAFDSFGGMRLAEGEKMAKDVLNHLETLESIRESIALRAPQAVKESNEKMRSRIKELLEGAEYDESRLMTECAVFADKADISEELARLASHFEQFRNIINEDKPVGRKLDFLVQEMNREVNTIGSKANDGEIARSVIEAKSTVEKIREQIQNIE